MDKPQQHWAVEIRVNGEQILCIESNCLSGVDNISDYTDIIESCAKHLLGFIGKY